MLLKKPVVGIRKGPIPQGDASLYHKYSANLRRELSYSSNLQ
jgi:hypothetical protein